MPAAVRAGLPGAAPGSVTGSILCDLSAEMLEMAAVANKDAAPVGEITLLHLDLQEPTILDHGPFDLVALHGVAEWTAAPEELIRHACTLVRPGGMLSLLVFNPDKLLLKEGINGDVGRYQDPDKNKAAA